MVLDAKRFYRWSFSAQLSKKKKEAYMLAIILPTLK